MSARLLRTLAAVSVGLALIAVAACEPEHVEKKTDQGWVGYTIGVCEAGEGLEPERSCTEAKACKSYCCECENGTQYTVALCNLDQGCATFGEACAAAKSEVCG